MFKNVGARYSLRATLVGVAAACSAALSSADWQHIVFGGVLAALAYAGIGAAVPAVEPSIGKKLGP